MAKLPEKDIIFNDHITGIDARPYFEDWYDVVNQGIGACELVTYKVENGAITPEVAEFLVDTDNTSDEILLIHLDKINKGAVVRMASASADRSITLKGSDHIQLQKNDIVLSPNFIVELKNVDDHWEVVSNYFEKLIAVEGAKKMDAIEQRLSSGTVANASNANTLKGMSFNWSGQGGQPTWLWGGNDGVNHYVYNPASFRVDYANSAHKAENALRASQVAPDNWIFLEGDPQIYFSERTGDLGWPVATAHIHVGPGADIKIRDTVNTSHNRWGEVLPADNLMVLGFANNRWRDIWATNASIVTSDERVKKVVNDNSYTDKVFQAWSTVNFKFFKMLDSIKEKGEAKARIHAGLLAQDIERAFEAEGLSGFDLALLCYDEWEDEVRDEECTTQLTSENKISPPPSARQETVTPYDMKSAFA